MTALSPQNLELAQRIERHCFTAWPARAEMDLNGWRVRLSGGFSQRQDCVTPQIKSAADPQDQIAWCERFYSERQAPCVVRLTDLYEDPSLEPYLLGRGYRPHGQTHVMACDLIACDLTALNSVSPVAALSDMPTDDWIGTAMMADKRAALYVEALAFTMTRMPSPKVFAEVGDDDGTLAIGCAAAGQNDVGQGLMGVFSMRTLPDARRMGYGRQILSSLLAWGKAKGATTAWLQVERANEPAVALYRAAGFQPLYDYRYLVRSD